MASFVHRFLLFWLSLALAGCELFLEPDPAGPAPLPDIVPVTAPTPHEWSRVAIGEPFVLEVELRLPDGSLATDYELTWATPADSVSGTTAYTNIVEVVRQHVSPGRERLVITGKATTDFPGVGCRVQVRDPSSGVFAPGIQTLGPFHIRFYGSEPATLALPPAMTRLGVGEVRPFELLATAVLEEGSAKGPPSHLPVTLESSDPSVVRVGEDGRSLHAVSVGTAMITARCGAVSRQAEVTVDALVLGRPSPATLRSRAESPRPVLFPIITHLGGAIRGDDLLVLDERGWPFATAVINNTLWAMEWTGTGVGWWRISRPGEEVIEPGSSVFDERGNLYVAYRTLGLGIVVAERAKGASLSGLRHRPLFPLAELWADQDWQPTFSSFGHVSIQPRTGGGAWVLLPIEFSQAAGIDRCRTIPKLFAVGDEAIGVQQISDDVRRTQCELPAGSARWSSSSVLYGQRAGMARPDLYLTALFSATLGSGLLLASADGTWTMPNVNLFPRAGRPDGHLSPGIFLVYSEKDRALLPAGIPSLTYWSSDPVDLRRQYAGSNYLVRGSNVVPVMAGRLFQGEAIHLKLISDYLLDASDPIAVTAIPGGP